ncbi:nucleotide-binding universal stress UspA family protein [Paraburkholderia youngii]|uniref:universal stress protein n=1 Tax=Paraburkholderia youngii TaxID=2782701 RepID=UPI003D246F46
MLKLLIPVLDDKGALEAARHGAFLFAEKCVSEVEVIEVLDDLTQGRVAAFHSRSALRKLEKERSRDALTQTRAILDESGVPYTWKRVFGPPERTIAKYAAKDHADIVVLDASHLGFFHRWTVLAKLWRLSSTPVTMLH